MLNEFKKHLANLYQTLIHLFDKDTLLGKGLIALIAFYAPVQSYALCILGLIILDVVTGIWASLRKGEPFKSRILRKGLIEKIALYGMLFTGTIFMGKLLQSVMHYETFYIAWVFTILVSVYELTSVIENILVINPELAFLGRLKKLLVKVEDKVFENAEKKLDVLDDTEKKEK